MKKNVLYTLAGACAAALLVFFTGVQTAHAQVAAIVLQNNGSTLQKAGEHLLSAQQTAGGYLGQIDSCGPCGSCDSVDGRAAWVNYIGKQNSLGFVNTLQPILSETVDLDSNGVQVGTDLYRSKRKQFGLLFDYTGSVTKYDGSDILESDDFRGGFYYAQVFDDNSDFRVLMEFGTANHHEVGVKRNINSDSFNATFEYGKRRFPVQNVSWRPYIALDVNYAYVGADTVDSVSFRNAKLSQTYFRIGTDFITQIKRFTVRADLSYNVDLNSGRLKVCTYDSDNNYGWVYDRLHIGRQFVTVGLTGQYDFNRRSAVFASFGVDAFFDRDSRPYQSIGTVGYSFVW